MHETAVSKTTDWITPQWIIDALGGYECFDLDPCASQTQPWKTANRMISLPEDGLAAEWEGAVWLNPPYGRKLITPWLEKMAIHNNGIALLPARTSELWFHNTVFRHSTGMHFIRGRVQFYCPDGKLPEKKSGNTFPSVLVCYGNYCLPNLAMFGMCHGGRFFGKGMDLSGGESPLTK